jgi:TPR repeat protein
MRSTFKAGILKSGIFKSGILKFGIPKISLVAALILVTSGCQATQLSTNSASTTDTSTATETHVLSRAEAQALASRREAFISAPDFDKRISRLLELEQQALQLAVDEPLKLGSIGSAILDVYPGSQTGHYVMSRFYGYVESADAQAEHDNALKDIHAAMSAAGNGSADAPFPVMTIYDAQTYAKSNNSNPVGSIYQVKDLDSFGLLLVTRPEDRPLQQLHFDLSSLLLGFSLADHPSDKAATPEQSPAHSAQHNPWTLMQMLAARMDTAAQTAIGRYLSRQQKYEDAIGWLRLASRSDNVLANAMLGQIYLVQAEASQDPSKQTELRELALENHLHAIALGSTDSMYTLANLYINDYYGEEDRAAAIPLLRQAGELGHADSLLYLGYLYNIGREVEQDPIIAAQYFRKAAELNNTQAILSYGRFITSLKAEDQVTTENARQARDWLNNLASAGNSEAMVVLGNLYARGIGTKTSTARAIRWYKKAVAENPEDADIVNEIAWTLTVSDISRLRRADYAKGIMDELMSQNADARSRPEYLDTWAATHAGIGDFDRAVTLQEEAITQAAAQDRQDVLEILNKHLNLFKTGETITERAP